MAMIIPAAISSRIMNLVRRGGGGVDSLFEMWMWGETAAGSKGLETPAPKGGKPLTATDMRASKTASPRKTHGRLRLLIPFDLSSRVRGRRDRLWMPLGCCLCPDQEHHLQRQGQQVEHEEPDPETLLLKIRQHRVKQQGDAKHQTHANARTAKHHRELLLRRLTIRPVRP